MKNKDRPDELEQKAVVNDSRARHSVSRATKIVASTLGLIAFALGETIQLRGEDKQADIAGGDQRISIQARIIEAPVGTLQGLVKGDELDPNAPTIMTEDQTNILLKRINQMRSASILAAPGVTTKSGNEATVQSGREVLLERDNPKTEFVGISLKFLPTVEDKDITLKIEASVSEQTGATGKHTIIQKRKVESQSCIQAGGTMILRQKGATKNGANMETIILITPKLVTD